MNNVKKIKIGCIVLFSIVTIGMLSGCVLINVGISTLYSKKHFLPLKTDKRILVEMGAESYADEIVKVLDQAIKTVEKKQYKPFSEPVVIYVCASQESFSKYSGVRKKGRAAVTLKKVYVSPKLSTLIKKGNNIQDPIIHELSHLHLEQQMGSYTYYSNIPFWFQEGLAMFVSNGSGIREVDNKELQKYILEGNTFELTSSGSVFFRSRGYPKKKLTGLMWLRQVESFVKYLHSIDRNKFKKFLLSFQDGIPFGEAFEQSYGDKIQSIWEIYLLSFNEPNKKIQRTLKSAPLI